MGRKSFCVLLCALASVGTAGLAIGQPGSNALVPGQIAPYAPERAVQHAAGPQPTASISTPSGPASIAPVAAGGRSAAVNPSDYRLGAGDKLRVLVFDEDKLSGEFIVAGNGRLSLPLIGDVQASGRTVGQVLADITERLRVYLKYPQVSAEVETFRPYFILGEVAHPGEYPYSDDITVLNAVATAGGFTYRAQHKFVFIQRAHQTSEQRVKLTDSLALAPGDTVRIAERYF